jgi:hypothetical protein
MPHPDADVLGGQGEEWGTCTADWRMAVLDWESE